MMLNRSDPDLKLYCKSMGKLFRVRAICRSDDEANEVCRKDDHAAVIAQSSGGLIFLADKYETRVSSDVVIDH